MRYYFSTLFLILVPFILWGQKDLASITLSIEIDQETIPAILNEIEHKTEITFSYNNSLFDSKEKKSLLIHNGTLKEALEKLMPSDIGFISNSGNVVLYRDSRKRIESGGDFNQKNDIQGLKTSDLKTKDFVGKDLKEEIIHSEKEEEPGLFDEDGIKVETQDRQGVEKLDFLYRNSFKEVKSVEYEVNRGLIGWDMSKTDGKKEIVKDNMVRYFFQPFYQFSLEFSNYKNLNINHDWDFIKDVLAGGEKNIFSDRKGVLGIVSFDGFTISSGIGLMNSAESYHYKTSSSPDETDIFIDTIDTPIMDDTIGFSVIGKNQYNYLSFPIFVGYKWDITKKIFVGGESGLWINVLTSRSGRYIDLESEIPYKIMDLSYAPLNKTRMEAVCDLYLGYEILDQLYATFSTSYSFFMGSEFRKNYPIRKNKSAFNFKFGLILEL